jgi:outer membrane protein OmpA-like peptidoglycan-associated protein
MVENTTAVLLIEGHTNAIGTEQHNVLLSFSRAKAVASLLGHMGIPERRITIRAAGSMAAKDQAGQLARERRAFIRVEGIENCNEAGTETEQQ